METHNLSAPVRSSERVLLRIPIRVEGKDASGDAFEEITQTLVVNQSGGLIVLSHVLQARALIRITNIRSQISCFFEVVMQAASSLSGKPEWGVKCLEPEVEIWGVRFPPRTEEPTCDGGGPAFVISYRCLKRPGGLILSSGFWAASCGQESMGSNQEPGRASVSASTPC